MKRSDQLKQQRATKINEWDVLVNKVTEEKRAFTEDENDKIEAYRNDCNALDAQIDAQLDLEARAAAKAAAEGKGVDTGEEKEKGKVQERFSITKMFRTALKGQELTGAEKEAQEIAVQENRDAKVSFDDEQTGQNRIMVPLSFIRASQQTVTQDSGEYGGQLVENMAPRVVMGLEPKLWIEELGATLLTGLSGGNLTLPVANSYAFEWLAEGADITKQKGKFVGPTLSAKRAGAAVSLSNRLLAQKSINVDNLVRGLLAKGWENAMHSAAINGPGGVAPLGILGTAGDTAAVAANFLKIVELQGLIEENDSTENNLAYLLHPKLKAALKTKSKDTGSGRFVLDNNEIDGYKFVSTSLVPVGDDGGTAVYPLLFGDFAQVFIGQWGAVSFLVNPYSEDLADSTRITVNTMADVAIANPKSFAKNGFLTNA